MALIHVATVVPILSIAIGVLGHRLRLRWRTIGIIIEPVVRQGHQRLGVCIQAIAVIVQIIAKGLSALEVITSIAVHDVSLDVSAVVATTFNTSVQRWVIAIKTKIQ